MKKIRIETLGESCESCGYPFAPGDTALDMTDEYGPLACSRKCADWLREDERRKHRNEPQSLSCFI